MGQRCFCRLVFLASSAIDLCIMIKMTRLKKVNNSNKHVEKFIKIWYNVNILVSMKNEVD